MSDIDTGGPAFPLAESEKLHAESGMTLRDYFAAAALSGLLSGPCSKTGVPMTEWFDCPQHAYALADAMIAARNGGKRAQPLPSPPASEAPHG